MANPEKKIQKFFFSLSGLVDFFYFSLFPVIIVTWVSSYYWKKDAKSARNLFDPMNVQMTSIIDLKLQIRTCNGIKGLLVIWCSCPSYLLSSRSHSLKKLNFFFHYFLYLILTLFLRGHSCFRYNPACPCSKYFSFLSGPLTNHQSISVRMLRY